jgi:hypothetical protein
MSGLFADELVSIPRKGQCLVDAVFSENGYVMRWTSFQEASKIHEAHLKLSPWCYERVFEKDGRAYIFDKWDGKQFDEPKAVIARDVTKLLEIP